MARAEGVSRKAFFEEILESLSYIGGGEDDL
jgi:hypothetical protein